LELLRITLRSTPDPTLVPPKPADGAAGAIALAQMADSPGNRLVAAWQAGGDREEIFQRIFRTYYRPVHSFFAKRGFPPDECQDLMQETFLKVYRGLPSFRRQARFETWLFQIAANLYRNTLRSQATLKREAQEVSLDEMVEEPGGPAAPAGETEALDRVLSKEGNQVLRHAVADLPCQMRRCVELRVHQDLRYKEIADLMQVSIDTVKAHLYQARQQLKGKLSGYFADPEF
jgi:RNA polymerase sigma-70 factor (ECF subfamily)